MGWKNALKKAFPYTIPVLTGYLFIGIAFGVMFAAKGYSFWWAILMSLLVYAGSGQYLAVNFFVPGFSLLRVVILTLTVNIRHMFYGISFLEKFNRMGKKKWYMVFALTDETYSLLATTKTPAGVDEKKFLFSIAVLDQSYWIIGSLIGSLAGTYIRFDSTGIDFAMTALFTVLLIEQLLDARNLKPALLGIALSVGSLLIFGAERFVFPALTSIVIVLLLAKKQFAQGCGAKRSTGGIDTDTGNTDRDDDGLTTKQTDKGNGLTTEQADKNSVLQEITEQTPADTAMSPSRIAIKEDHHAR